MMRRFFVSASSVAAIIACCFGLGSTVSAQTMPSSTTEVFGDWIVQCRVREENQSKTNACQIVQELKEQKSGQRMALIAIDVIERDKVHVQIFSPLGVKMTDGLDLTLDKKNVHHGQFDTCYQDGCIVNLSLPLDAFQELSDGSNMDVSITSFNDGKKIRIGFSTSGLRGAFGRLQEVTKIN